jgi:1,2-diacylglycerol 3-beta-glucosyltransferase
VGLFAFAYLMSFLPNLVLAILYYRRNERGSLLRSIGLAHLMLLFNYLSYISAWIAFIRLLRGQTSWDKTARSAEPDVAAPREMNTPGSLAQQSS